jgi:hypothetical protein
MILLLPDNCYFIRSGENCSNREDSEESINEVLTSVGEEIGSWRQMVDEFGAIVYNNWKFPEYLYPALNRTEL